ncbi:MAG: N-glycosylase/DNA lyase [Patescibacteria group bacterium]|jgi:N-glycosylase/DNA lyase
MKELILKINEVKNSEISHIIEQRLSEFVEVGTDSDSVFSELCFCLLTANFTAARAIEMQSKYDKDFLVLGVDELKILLKKAGHRFWPQRAERIVLARGIRDVLMDNIGLGGGEVGEHEARVWVRDNVKGVGMKESSHFLRNIGFLDLAIIDFHIVDLLVEYGLVERPKTLTPQKYLEIEEVLRNLGNELGMSLSELDLYLWYLETGTILK